jgi:diguanylate cyclase (GGDEF)-like protein
VEYVGLTGAPAIGALRRIESLDWAFVAEVPVAEAYRDVKALRNTAALILVALVLGIGFIAYRLGLLIVRPLDRLIKGAAVVAGGDFTVDLPSAGGGEVGMLTRVFNDMVARLREGRARLHTAYATLQRQNEELELLSVTDGLTGLYNRRRLMEVLDQEIERSKRLSHVCSALMMDVDHFKRYNDTHGHQRGDDVLKGVGAVLLEATREIDCAARYGGEEFFVLLPETGIADAADVAERIRARLKERIFAGGRVTISIGIAAFPAHAGTPEELIAAADAALYQAKREGRDRAATGTRVAAHGAERP